MSGNSGAWGLAMWRDDHGGSEPQELGISLEGGDAIVPYLPTVPLGCLTEPPEGMGVPPVRSGDVVFAQRDGVVQFADYYEPRILTFRVSICNDGCPGCDPDPASQTFLSLNGVVPGRAVTVDKPSLDIVGDLDVRVDAALTDWTPATMNTLISKFNTTGNQRSWRFLVFTTGALRLVWSADGTGTVFTATSTAIPVVADGAELWVRATLDVDNGAAGRTITFYTSPDGETWTQLGAPVVQAGVTSIFSSTANLAVGAHTSGTGEPMTGKVYAAEVYRGIDGTLVADPNFREEGAGTVIFDDSTGNVWEVIPPAVIASEAGAVQMSARQKAYRLTQEWSRNCNGATLVIFSDCHDPDATEEEKAYKGPYLVHGRPRVADIQWLRSDIGCANVLLRFDAEDARLRLAATPDSDPWTSTNCVIASANDGPEQVEVVGSLCVYPVITLNADLTTAPITVTYGDWEFLYNQPITGDPVVVDTRWGIAVQGNIEVTQNLSGEYEQPLAPGTHDVELTTGNPADDGLMQFCWDNAVVSG